MTTSEPQLLTNAIGVYSSTLYVPITGATDSGVYRCTVFNSNGTAYAETNVDLILEGKISIYIYCTLYLYFSNLSNIYLSMCVFFRATILHNSLTKPNFHSSRPAKAHILCRCR